MEIVKIIYYNKMTNRNQTFFFFVLFLFCCFTSIFSNPVSKKKIVLKYGKTEKPQYCFIPYKQLQRPKIGLALSGGGARGFAQIGVLQILEANKIPIDFIVGTSIGSIIGGLYAAGYSPDQIIEITKQIDWANIMVDKPPRTNMFVAQKQESGKAILQLRFNGTKLSIPQAITPGQKLTSILTSLTLRADFQTSSNFDQLKIPFRALACDLVTGNKVLLKDGNLAEAMRSSTAVPLLFDPVSRDNMMLVDGGLINNIPVDETRAMGADLVIALDTSSELNEKSLLNVPWKVADQVTSIMQSEKSDNQRRAADVLIEPDLNNFKSDDFELANQLIQKGREKAASQINKIKELISNLNESGLSNKSYDIESLTIKGASAELKSIAQHEIDKIITSKTSYNSIYKGMQSVYKSGYFQDVKTLNTLENDSLLTITFLLTPNPSFSAVKFEGNTVFSDSLLELQINCKPGFPINCYQAKKCISNIIGLYKDEGYALINISDIHLAEDTLNIKLSEGLVSNILIEGNNKTKGYVILREFPLRAGNIFNINEADKGIDNIYSMNLFKTVSFELFKDQQQARVKIKVEEKAFNLIRLSYRYDLERLNKTKIELEDENFLGLANRLTLHTQFGTKDQVIKFKFRSDRIFNTFLTNTFDIYHQRQKHFIYSEGETSGEYRRVENGLSFSIGRQIERLGILSLIAAAKNIDLQSVSGEGYPTGTYDLKTLELQSIVDTQDKFPFPNFGKYYLFSYKLSSSTILNSQTSFFKLLSSFEFYTTFLKRNTIHSKLLWGTSDLTTPFIEQFRLGGQDSFFGLRENERIGRHIVNGSMEYRYEFPFGFPVDFYWSLQFNIGATWKDAVDIQPKDFIQGMGTSLSANTPIGPISFSVGRMSEGRNVFYFSAGFGF
ncbi:patatin-like phospholipase family protein [candidate division KSB1 bacterium]|nr:patatin-like phospholipase family protein [candidate division KSB1 bacterium]